MPRIGPVLLAAGCVRYLGIDGAQRMVAAARTTLRDTIGEAERCDIEAFEAAPASFDLVLSRMALHDVEDLDRVFVGARDWLSPGGRIVFSVVHPVISSHDARGSTDEPRSNWLLADFAGIDEVLATTIPATVLIVSKGESRIDAWLATVNDAVRRTPEAATRRQLTVRSQRRIATERRRRTRLRPCPSSSRTQGAPRSTTPSRSSPPAAA